MEKSAFGFSLSDLRFFIQRRQFDFRESDFSLLLRNQIVNERIRPNPAVFRRAGWLLVKIHQDLLDLHLCTQLQSRVSTHNLRWVALPHAAIPSADTRPALARLWRGLSG